MEFLEHSNFIEDERSAHALTYAKRAWDYALRNIDKINLNYILDIHKILMIQLRPDIAGKLRNCDVYIGGYCKYFTSEALLKEQLNEWISNSGKSVCYQVDVEKANNREHVEFENIHPFEDGNGRVGRILYNIHRLKLGLPIHIIHEGEEQIEYYSWFTNNK